MATLSSATCIEFSQSASLSRQWKTHKGLPIFTSTNELSLRKSQRCIPSHRTISRVDIRSLIDLLRSVSLANEHHRLVIPWSFANTMQLCQCYWENPTLSLLRIAWFYAIFIYNLLLYLSRKIISFNIYHYLRTHVLLSTKIDS